MHSTDMGKTKNAYYTSIIIRIIGAGFLFLALSSLPIGYYKFLRWVVFSVAAYMAYFYFAKKEELTAGVWLFTAIALLFNPFMPFYLGRDIWRVTDLAAGVVFLASIFFIGERPKATSGQPEDNKAIDYDRYDAEYLKSMRKRNKGTQFKYSDYLEFKKGNPMPSIDNRKDEFVLVDRRGDTEIKSQDKPSIEKPVKAYRLNGKKIRIMVSDVIISTCIFFFVGIILGEVLKLGNVGAVLGAFSVLLYIGIRIR